MTPQEFSLEFDIGYNNIKSQSAPGLDEYEKSVFLTSASEGLVYDIYEGRNDKLESFEETEIERRYLDKLIKQTTVTTNTDIEDIQHINPDSVFFEIPTDLMIITNEQLKIESDISCYDGVIIDVIPVRQDEYLVHKKNPFRKPTMKGRTNQAWRLDYGNNVSRVVEILAPSEATSSEYIVRYIKKPNPIILQDFTEQGLTINGISTVSNCELDSMVHRAIVDRAVKLAEIAYK